MNESDNVAIEFCTFAHDSTNGSGGAVYLLEATATMTGNTFYRCKGGIGSAFVLDGATATVSNNIAMECERAFTALLSTVDLAGTGCNLFWGNVENYYYWPEEATATDIVADPQFYDPAALDFTVAGSSPAASGNAGSCGPIGAHGVGCGSVAIEPSTWGRIKGRFRTGAP